MDDAKLIVLAIGGNSLITDTNHVTVQSQYEAAVRTASHVAKLIQAGYRVAIAHGNGPQVGFILRRVELASSELHLVPLDSCVADTQGALGYNIQMALYNELKKLGIEKTVATIVTQVVVDEADPSFQHPTKPIGSFMNEETARRHEGEDGYSIMEDAGRGWRRVVASPLPKHIVEMPAVHGLLAQDVIVIAAGGGGIPVVEAEDGSLQGREAVIDKDLAACLMAKELNADIFLISTAVEKVSLHFGKPDQRSLDSCTSEEAARYISEGHFAPGSMLPKIQAMIDFVESTGHRGIITDPAHLYEAVIGKAGTEITP